MAVRSISTGSVTNSLVSSDSSTNVDSSTSVDSSTDVEKLQEQLEAAYQEKYASLLQQLQTTTSSDSGTSTYTAMSTAAEDVSDHLNSIQSLLTTGDTDSAISEISDFVTSYNSMLANMSSSGGAESSALISQFKAYFSENEDALSAVGITMSKSGVLTLDTETLAATDSDSLKAVFGTENTLVSDVSKLSDTVKQVASLKISGYNSLQTLYGNSGTLNQSNLCASILDAFS